MGELIGEYERVAKSKRSWSGDEPLIRAYIRPHLDTLKVRDVTTDHIETLHAKISKHAPVRANRCVSCVSRIFALRSGGKCASTTRQRAARGTAKSAGSGFSAPTSSPGSCAFSAAMIQAWIALARQPELRTRPVFLEDYDLIFSGRAGAGGRCLDQYAAPP